MHTDTAIPNCPLFRPGDTPASAPVTLLLDGRPITAAANTSVAAALLVNGCGAFRSTPVSGAPRAAYCMMGVCFECLVEVDGVPARQACLVPVREGMVVRRQHGAVALDVPVGEDHHVC